MDCHCSHHHHNNNNRTTMILTIQIMINLNHHPRGNGKILRSMHHPPTPLPLPLHPYLPLPPPTTIPIPILLTATKTRVLLRLPLQDHDHSTQQQRGIEKYLFLGDTMENRDEMIFIRLIWRRGNGVFYWVGAWNEKEEERLMGDCQLLLLLLLL